MELLGEIACSMSQSGGATNSTFTYRLTTELDERTDSHTRTHPDYVPTEPHPSP